MPSVAKTLTAAEIASVAKGAGFGKSKDMLATAVAVALAESSGRTTAVSPTGCCHGLWQINTEVHPYTKEQMQDPAQNAAAAWKISGGGTNWKPWSAYTNKSYLLYRPSGITAANKSLATNDDPSGFVNPITVAEVALGDNPVSNLVEFPVRVTAWISDRNNIFRIMKVIAGTILVAAGVVLVAKPLVGNVVSGAVGTVAKGLKK
jgi:hypothetical protein